MEVRPLTGKALDATRLPPASITAYEGSVRSGKTFTSLLEWLKFIRTGPEGALLMTGRTERTIVANMLVPLQEWLGPERLRINRGLGTANILGREVMIVGANNEQAVTKIQGRTLAGAYVDEAATLPESYFNMLSVRLSVPGARMWLSSNPEGPEHWLKKKWLDRASLWIDQDSRRMAKDPDDYPEGDPDQPLDLHRVSWNLGDNPHLPPEFVERVKRSYSGLWYRRYVEGAWCVAEGAIYDGWDVGRHVVAASVLPKIARVISVGIDWGFNHPTRGILLGISDEPQPRLVALDEWAPPSMTDVELSGSFRAWLASQPEAWRNPAWIYVDSAAPHFSRQLFNDGHSNVGGATRPVLSGIALISSLLATGRLIVSSTCTELIKEIPMYAWDAKATARGVDAPNKAAGHDDSCDGLRYAIVPTHVLWENAIRLTETPVAA